MIGSVHKIAQVLNCFSKDEPVLGNSEIAMKLDMNPSTVHHLVQALVHEGMLVKDSQHKYRLGWKLLEWSSLVMHQQDVFNDAFPLVEELIQRFNGVAHIGMFDEGDVVFILKVASRRSVQLPTYIGGRKPAYCTSSGKILLAYNPSHVQTTLAKGLKQWTPNTITEVDKLNTELNEIRKQGYAISDNENDHGMYGIAAPVRSYTGRVVAALNMVGPGCYMKGNVQSMIQSVVNTADAISRELGYIYN